MSRPLSPRQLEIVRRLKAGQVLRRPKGWRSFVFRSPQQSGRSWASTAEDPGPTTLVDSDEVMRLLGRDLVALHHAETGERIYEVPPHLNGRHLEVRIRQPEDAR